MEKYQKYKNKNINLKQINYNININYPVNLRHIRYNDKDILLFGDFHGDTNNYCKNMEYLNLDDFIKKMIEQKLKVALYLEFPYSEDSYEKIEEEFDVKEDKEPLALVAKSFSKCYNSKCSNNFSLYPVDIRYYDEFLKAAVFSVIIEQKSNYDRNILQNSIKWYIDFLNNVLEMKIVKDLLFKITKEEKEIMIKYFEKEKKEFILLLVENLNLISVTENTKDFEILVEQLNKQVISINAFIMDIYIILLFMISAYGYDNDILIGYFGMSHTKRIFDFFINNMKNNTKIIKQYIPNKENGEYDDNIYPDKEKFSKYPERCLKNVDIEINTKNAVK
jgi:hypothetical protein